MNNQVSFSIQNKKVKVIFILFVLLNKKAAKKVEIPLKSQLVCPNFERHSFFLLLLTIIRGALGYHYYLVELIDIGSHQYCLIQKKLHKLANTNPTFGRTYHPFFQ